MEEQPHVMEGMRVRARVLARPYDAKKDREHPQEKRKIETTGERQHLSAQSSRHGTNPRHYAVRVPARLKARRVALQPEVYIFFHLLTIRNGLFSCCRLRNIKLIGLLLIL